MPTFFDACLGIGISRVVGQAQNVVGGLFARVKRVIRYGNQQYHSVDFNLGPHARTHRCFTLRISMFPRHNCLYINKVLLEKR